MKFEWRQEKFLLISQKGTCVLMATLRWKQCMRKAPDFPLNTSQLLELQGCEGEQSRDGKTQ